VRNAARVRPVWKWFRAIPTERNLIGIVRELRRLNRSITVPLERDLKRAGCPRLECYEVLREIDESGDVRLRPVELQTRLALPQHRVSRLIDRLAKDGYVEREKAAFEARGHFVVITDSGRRASKDASLVLAAALRLFFYKKRPSGRINH
jgi:DNA-binding MarR family transcriptional regulator